MLFLPGGATEAKMDENSNEAFDFARRISDYFSMALNVGIGAGAAFALWELAEKHPDSEFRNKLFAGIIAICTLSLAASFVVSVWFDMRGLGRQKTVRWRRIVRIAAPLVAFCLLLSLIYFARTTTQMMM